MSKDIEMTTFPTFPLQDLISTYLDDYNLRLLPEYFKNPKPDLWSNILTELASKYFYQTFDTLEKKLRCVHDPSNYPILYEAGEYQLKLVLLLKSMLSNSGLDDLTYLDLARPTRGKLCIILSALLNRFRFNFTHRQKIEDRQIEEKRDMDIHKNISNVISNSQAVLDSINKELKDLDEQEKIRKRKFHEISLQCDEEIVVQENLGISKLEAAISANQETLLRKEEIIKDLQNRLKQADSRIVKSPFRLQQTIDHYKRKLPDQIHRVEEANAKYREEREGLRQDCERLEDCQAFDDVVHLLRDLANKNLKSKEAVKNFTSMMDNAETEWKGSVVTVKNKTLKNKKTMEIYHSLMNEMQVNQRELEDQCSGKEQLLKNFQANFSKYDEHLSVLSMKSNKAAKEHQEDYASYCDSIKRFEQLVKEQERKIFNKFMDRLKFIQKNSIYKTYDV